MPRPRRSPFERHFEYLHGRPPPKIVLDLEIEDEPQRFEGIRSGRGWRAQPEPMSSDELYTRLTVGALGLVLLGFLGLVSLVGVFVIGTLLLG